MNRVTTPRANGKHGHGHCNSRALPESPAEKHALAEKLAQATNDVLKVSYLPTATTDDADDKSRGHVFTAHLDVTKGDSEICTVDDREGDVPDLLAQELRRVAAVYTRLACEVERHAEQKPSTGERLTLVAVECCKAGEGTRIAGVMTPDDAAAFLRGYNSNSDATGWRARVRPVVWSLADEQLGKLPQLAMGIFNGDGSFLRAEYIDDPREAFARYYNELAADGRHAAPLLQPPAIVPTNGKGKQYQLHVRHEDGTSYFRRWREGQTDFWRVTFTSHLTGSSAVIGEYGDRADAEETAAYLGPCASISGPHALEGGAV